MELLESRHLPYMIIGAMAVAIWGQPRATADVDFTVLTDPEGLESLGAEAERQGDEAALDRRRALEVEGRSVWFVSAEDLIIMKLKAGRPRDFEDVVSVLSRHREKLDMRYMEEWAWRVRVNDELSYVLRGGTIG